MIQDIKAISYTAGLLERGMHPSDLPIKIFKGTALTSGIREVLQQTNILNCAGTYGDESVGYPLEYDKLTIELTDETTARAIFAGTLYERMQFMRAITRNQTRAEKGT